MKTVFVGLLFLTSCLSAYADSASNYTARAAAIEFLALLDAREYDMSYSTASSVLREEVSQKDWVTHVSNLRDPLGEVYQRKTVLTELQESLPDAPPGEYVIFTYDSSFKNKKFAAEVVVVAKGVDGVWRVVGYYFG